NKVADRLRKLAESHETGGRTACYPISRKVSESHERGGPSGFVGGCVQCRGHRLPKMIGGGRPRPIPRGSSTNVGPKRHPADVVALSGGRVFSVVRGRWLLVDIRFLRGRGPGIHDRQACGAAVPCR